MRTLSTRCVISGGGPAGIMTGYLLARAGIDVVVLEKWPDFFRDFRGDTIHPSTMDILRELGLLDEFLALPHNEMTRMAMHVGGREVVVADLTHVPSPTAYIAFIPQWNFLDFLARKAREFPSFHLLMETESVGLLKDRGRVVGLRAASKGEEFEIRSELSIGADGRHSTVRELGGFRVEQLGSPIDVLWFRIGRAGQDDKQSLGYLEAGRALVMLDRREYWQCAFVIEKGGFDAIKAQGLDAFRASVASLSRMPAQAVAEVDSWDKVKLLSVAVDHARRWAQNGLLLIGDAAHAMSPLGGVGINYAIQDAVAAANILVPAFRAGDLSLPVLERVQARRGRAVKRMQKLQVFIQDKALSPLLSKSEGGISMPWFLRLFALLPVLRRIPAYVIGIGFGPEHVRIDFR